MTSLRWKISSYDKFQWCTCCLAINICSKKKFFCIQCW